MKLFFDLLPVILFFITFRYGEGNKDWAADFATRHFGDLVSGGQVGPGEAPVLLATLVVIAATLTQVVVLKLMRRKVDVMLWVSLVLVVSLGGLTVWFHNDTFIKWKPSGLYWVFALTLLISEAVWGKNLIRTLMGEQLELPAAIWKRLNLSWVVFFALMGVLNLWVAFSFETATWVNFKLFGATGLMLAFMVGQGFYIQRHLPPLEEDAESTTNKDAKP